MINNFGVPAARIQKSYCRGGVRVSGRHLCEAEAPTEAAAETSSFSRFFKPKQIYREGAETLPYKLLFIINSHLKIKTGGINASPTICYI